MYLLGKRIDTIIADDIKRLVNNEIKETTSLDYKRDLNLLLDKDKKEFLFDISSMANTDGGCFVYGIEEKKDDKNRNTGIPEKIVGIQISNYDKLLQQIEDLVKGNTDPNVNTLGFKHLVVDNMDVLVIGIPKGLGLPIMITFQETNKFYKRRNSGKYSVDVYELNQMFMQNQIIKELANNFRYKTIESIRKLKLYPNLEIIQSTFIHIIPFNFMSNNLDLSTVENSDIVGIMQPMQSYGYNRTYNLNGFSTFSNNYNRTKIESYDQIYRSGIYEVYTSTFYGEEKTQTSNNTPFFYGLPFAKDTIKKIFDGIAVLKKLQIEPPYIIALSLHGMHNIGIKSYRGISPNKFTVDDIYLPPIILPSDDVELYPLLKISYDMVWQSVGFNAAPEIK